MTPQPIGYFVHHQGRGHAERCAALVNALPHDRSVVIFCARPELLPSLRDGVDVVRIPSLFEPTGEEIPSLSLVAQPETVHCAPLGWPGIRRAMAQLATWFEHANPALVISDVSAEIAQLARLCSVPHIGILQHGKRDDPAHAAAWQGAAGMLAPFDRSLAQDDWPEELLDKTYFAAGVGVSSEGSSRRKARERLGIERHVRVFLVMSGAGGDGLQSAALGVGARAYPTVAWHTIGPVQSTWHASEPSNLTHHGWVENAGEFLAAADLVVSSTGNTTTHQILSAGRPWVSVPQWCYFDEQLCKSQALAHAQLAHHEPHLPSSTVHWRRAIDSALSSHDGRRQRRAVQADATALAATWVDELCSTLWSEPARPAVPLVSVLTIASGRAAHLHNLVLGLERQSVAPGELVVGVMQEAEYDDLPATRFPVRQILIPGSGLPLAAARNSVAGNARHEVLVFLDVDCIPAPELVADYARSVRVGVGLLMGEVRYLPEGSADEDWTYVRFESESVEHDSRRQACEDDMERCDDYRCFWSLNFAMHYKDFGEAGGFDERYIGYGGEDTDFARTLNEKRIPFSWMRGARAYHQFHDQRMPPVQHLTSVVRNAELFETKWGHRTMDHWLYCFSLMGLIDDSPDGIRILSRQPSLDAHRFATAEGAAYASTIDAMQQLEQGAVQRYIDANGSPPPDTWLDRKRFVNRPVSRHGSTEQTLA